MTKKTLLIFCHSLCMLLLCVASAANGSWTKKASFPASSRNYGIGFTIGSKCYYGMGQKQTKPFIYKTYNDLWEYDPTTNVWSQKADFPGPGRLMTKGFSINQKIYAGFGFVIAASGPNAGSNDYQTDLYEFDPATNKWIQKSNGLLGRGDLFFTINNKMYSVNPEFRAVNKYNAETDTWFESKWEKNEAAPPSSDISGNNVLFSVAEKEYIITTAWKKNKIVNQLWELDPNKIIWHRKNDLPTPGSDSIFVISTAGKNYAVTGNRKILEYNPETDSWTLKNELPEEHKGFSPVFSSEERIYGFSKFEFWEFIP